MKTFGANKQIAAVLVAILTMVDPVGAEVLRYRTGGPWEDVSDGALNGWGVNPDQPGVDVPMADDEARINWAGSTVTLDYEAPTINRLLIGVDESGTLEINEGGVLNATEDVAVGNNGFVDGSLDVNDGAVVNVGRILWVARGPVVNDVLGFLNINSGGVVNVTSHLWWGSTGIAEVNISGTLNQTDGILGLGSADFSTFGGTATVNVLDGGELNLNNIHAGGTQLSIQPGSKIDISGSGRVTLPGDFVEVLEGYRDADLLFGNGVAGAVDINVETSGGGPGDFDGDGDVDGQDFLAWQRNPSVGDLFNDWQPNYGSGGVMQTVVTVAAGLSAASVPEPASMSLIVLASLYVVGQRRRN